MTLKEHRKRAKKRLKDIPLNRRTIAAIERGDKTVSVGSLETYLRALSLRLVYAVEV